jgi:hypothetical protein
MEQEQERDVAVDAEKRRLVTEAIAILRKAGEINECAAADFEERATAWYDQFDPDCVTVEQIVGKIRIENAMRRDKARLADLDRAGKNATAANVVPIGRPKKRDGAVTKPLGNKERQVRHRERLVASNTAGTEEYIAKTIDAGEVPTVSGAAAFNAAAAKAAAAAKVEPTEQVRNARAVALAKKIEKLLDFDGPIGEPLIELLNGLPVSSAAWTSIEVALGRHAEKIAERLKEVKTEREIALKREAEKMAAMEKEDEAAAEAGCAAYAKALAEGATEEAADEAYYAAEQAVYHPAGDDCDAEERAEFHKELAAEQAADAGAPATE